MYAQSDRTEQENWRSLHDKMFVWLGFFMLTAIFWTLPPWLVLDIADRRGFEVIKWGNFALVMVPMTIILIFLGWKYERARKRLQVHERHNLW